MRIVYLEDGWVPGAAAYALHTLQTVAAMGELGHDVTLVAPAHEEAARGPAVDEMRRELGLRGPFRLQYLPYLERPHRLRPAYFALAPFWARVRGAELVFTRNPRIAQIATLLRLRVVIEWHDPPMRRGAALARTLADEDRVVRWVFVSERLRQIMSEDLPLPASRCVVAHNGVALDLYADPPSRDEARDALGLPAGVPTVVHSGHLYAGRGVDLLLDVAAAMPGLQLVLVGGMPEDVAAVRADVSRRGLGNVLVAGHRPLAELPRWLAAADVLVMSYTAGAVTSDRRTRSIDFASPMKLFEYLAAGRPIVATRFPAVCEVLADGVNALLVEPGSADALRAGIERALADPEASARMASRARADAATRSWTERTKRILEGL